MTYSQIMWFVSISVVFWLYEENMQCWKMPAVSYNDRCSATERDWFGTETSYWLSVSIMVWLLTSSVGLESVGLESTWYGTCLQSELSVYKYRCSWMTSEIRQIRTSSYANTLCLRCYTNFPHIFQYYMVLKLKLCTRLCLLTFNRPLTLLACHDVRMFVQLCYLGQPIFRKIPVIANSHIAASCCCISENCCLLCVLL